MMNAELPNPTSTSSVLMTPAVKSITDGGLAEGDLKGSSPPVGGPTDAELLIAEPTTRAAGVPGARLSTTGWYGKLPAAGDFLNRRLPAEFREPWDRWLSQGMIHAKDKLADQWESTFLSFSVWRFLWISAQDIEPIWLGILMPGIDRVGRLFPLTVAMPVSRDLFTHLSIDSLDTRLDLLQDLALRVLEDDDIERFDSALRELPDLIARAPIAMGAQHDGEDLSSWVQSLGLTQLAAGGARAAFWLRVSPHNHFLRIESCPPPPASFLELVQFSADVEELGT
jgi:type VI secretion system protein ImpM